MQALKVGSSLRAAAVRPASASRVSSVHVQAVERLRLGNLSPAPGSHRDKARKGRGYAAGQGGTCGFGNRGQKCRSGPGVRPGFEGGQTPLYRRLPKLRGIAGGMAAGQPDFVVVNLKDLARIPEGHEVSIDSLKEKGVVRASGRMRNKPLKVLANGELKGPMVIKAAAFSAAAKAKIEAAGGTAEVVAQKPKWTRKAYNRLVAELKKQGKDYKVEALKKRVAKLQAKGRVSKTRLAKTSAKKAAKADFKTKKA